MEEGGRGCFTHNMLLVWVLTVSKQFWCDMERGTGGVWVGPLRIEEVGTHCGLSQSLIHPYTPKNKPTTRESMKEMGTHSVWHLLGVCYTHTK